MPKIDPVRTLSQEDIQKETEAATKRAEEKKAQKELAAKLEAQKPKTSEPCISCGMLIAVGTLQCPHFHKILADVRAAKGIREPEKENKDSFFHRGNKGH